MDHRIIDLHVHSTESDGTLTPKDLVAEAKKAGLAAFALTDHDTCQGVCKAMPLAASAGIELNSPPIITEKKSISWGYILISKMSSF